MRLWLFHLVTFVTKLDLEDSKPAGGIHGSQVDLLVTRGRHGLSPGPCGHA
jgi:hypothetical protein